MATVLHTVPGQPGEGGDDLAPLDMWTPPADLSAREVCELPLPDLQQVVGPVALVGGRLVIAGKSGDGKTTLVMAIAQAAAHGSEFLGWKGCGGTVLMFDLEQGLRTVQRRLHEANLSESEAVRYFRIPDGLALDTSPTQAAWMEGLIIKHQPVMVVLDPLYKLYQDADSNDERAMVSMMRMLDRWRDEHGFCLVIPMHLRKLDPRASDPTMDDVFGSGGLTRGAEVVLGIRKNAPGKSTLYFWKDRDGDLHEEDRWRLLFSHSEGFERSPEDAEPPMETTIQNAFLISGGGLMSIKEIRHATGKSLDRCRDAVARMLGAGQLAEGPRGKHGTKTYKLLHIADDALKRYEDIASGEWGG